MVTALGPRPCRVTRIDSLSLAQTPADYRSLRFTGGWGSEFEPAKGPLEPAITLESRSVCSSKGNHLWFGLHAPGQGALASVVAWSSNWAMRFTPLAQGGWAFSGGLNDWEFAKELATDQTLETPPLALALSADLDEASRAFVRVGRAHWYPRNTLSARAPAEWNHWWPYRDIEIDEATSKTNLAQAIQLGMEVCILDAG